MFSVQKFAELPQAEFQRWLLHEQPVIRLSKEWSRYPTTDLFERKDPDGFVAPEDLGVAILNLKSATDSMERSKPVVLDRGDVLRFVGFHVDPCLKTSSAWVSLYLTSMTPHLDGIILFDSSRKVELEQLHKTALMPEAHDDQWQRIIVDFNDYMLEQRRIDMPLSGPNVGIF